MVVREVCKNALDHLDAPIKDGIVFFLKTVTKLDFSNSSVSKLLDEILHWCEIFFLELLSFLSGRTLNNWLVIHWISWNLGADLKFNSNIFFFLTDLFLPAITTNTTFWILSALQLWRKFVSFNGGFNRDHASRQPFVTVPFSLVKLFAVLASKIQKTTVLKHCVETIWFQLWFRLRCIRRSKLVWHSSFLSNKLNYFFVF